MHASISGRFTDKSRCPLRNLSYLFFVYPGRIHGIINELKMKVTAIIPDEIIDDVKKYTGGKNITDSLIRALNDYLYRQRINHLSNELQQNPIQFREDFSSEGIRNNRKAV